MPSRDLQRTFGKEMQTRTTLDVRRAVRSRVTQISIPKCTCEDSSSAEWPATKYFKVNPTTVVEMLPAKCVH